MIRNFIIRLLVNAVALAIIVSLLPQGIRIQAETQQQQIQVLLLVALIFGIVNATVKPVLKLLTCSLIIFTFGLFLLVINGAMFMLTAWLSGQLPIGGRLVVDSFLWAVVGGVIMSLIGMVMEQVLGLDERVRVRTVREVRYVETRPRSRGRDDDFDEPMFPPPMPPQGGPQDPYVQGGPARRPPSDRPRR